jgi:hypothetical protein
MIKKSPVKAKVTFSNWLHVGLQRVVVLHFLLLIGYALQVIIYDASKVITAEVVLWRWLAVAGLLTVSAGIWYLAHNSNNDIATYKRLTFMLITADIVFASFNVYTQRGMASRAVALYAFAITSAAILLSRAAIFTAALLSAAAYIVTAVSYFTLHFNEGYKAELYGEVIFYSFGLFILAGLLSTLVRFGGNTANS